MTEKKTFASGFSTGIWIWTPIMWGTVVISFHRFQHTSPFWWVKFPAGYWAAMMGLVAFVAYVLTTKEERVRLKPELWRFFRIHTLYMLTCVAPMFLYALYLKVTT